MGRSARDTKGVRTPDKPERAVRGPRAGTTAGEESRIPDIATYRAAFSRRVQYALLARAMRRAEAGDTSKYSNGDFASAVSDVLKPDKPLLRETVRKWSAGDTTPDPVAIMAMARVLEVDPGWLTYGIHSGAPAPYDAATAGDEALGSLGSLAARPQPLGATVAAKTIRLAAPRAKLVAKKVVKGGLKTNGHQHKRR